MKFRKGELIKRIKTTVESYKYDLVLDVDNENKRYEVVTYYTGYKRIDYWPFYFHSYDNLSIYSEAFQDGL